MIKYITSDHHFGFKLYHKYNSKYNDIMRPHWSNAGDFLEWYVEQFNSVVPKFNSVVYFLGDFAINDEWARLALSRLNGERKVIVCGNHDVNKGYKYRFDSVEGLIIKKKKFIMSHSGVHPKELEVYEVPVNYHGHLHKDDYDNPRYVNCCVDYGGGKQIVIEVTNKGHIVHYGT